MLRLVHIFFACVALQPEVYTKGFGRAYATYHGVFFGQCASLSTPCSRVQLCASIDTVSAQACTRPRNGLFCTSPCANCALGIYKLVHSLCRTSACLFTLAHPFCKLAHILCTPPAQRTFPTIEHANAVRTSTIIFFLKTTFFLEYSSSSRFNTQGRHL